MALALTQSQSFRLCPMPVYPFASLFPLWLLLLTWGPGFGLGHRAHAISRLYLGWQLLQVLAALVLTQGWGRSIAAASEPSRGQNWHVPWVRAGLDLDPDLEPQPGVSGGGRGEGEGKW